MEERLEGQHAIAGLGECATRRRGHTAARSTHILKLLARKDEALLVRRDALLVLDLLLHVLDRVGRLDVERDRLARQGLDEDLHFDRTAVAKAAEGESGGQEESG